jgi:hypothetical protein
LEHPGWLADASVIIEESETVKISAQRQCLAAWFAALLAITWMLTSTVCRPQSSSSPSGSSSSGKTEQSGGEKYWTPERMRKAKPMELHPKSEIQPPKAASASPEPHAPPKGGPGSPPSDSDR